MWALRRASVNTFRAQGLNATVLRISSGLGPFTSHADDKSSDSDCGFTVNRPIPSNTCQCTIHFPTQFLVGSRGLSSQAGAKNGQEGEDDLEDGFSELENPESDLLDDADVVTEESWETEPMEDAEVDGGETVPKKFSGHSPLLKLILNESGQSVSGLLDDFFPKGEDVNRGEIFRVMRWLRRRKMYSRAMQLSEWLEKREGFDFDEQDYASRVDLIAKLHGLLKAEQYIKNIPEFHKKEVVYRSLLANCVSVANISKAEEIFNKMKDLGFPVTVFSCNQMLLLYKRVDKKKIADVLLMMENEDIRPTLSTYQILINAKGATNDIDGMEQIVETMKAEGIELTFRIQAILARCYAFSGYKEKAETILKEIEGDDLNSNRLFCPILISIYSSLGKPDDVERVWKVCESKPRDAEYLAAITGWGKLKNIERAETLFENMKKSIKKLSTKHYSTMLRVYAQNKMFSKGKHLLKEMGDNGCYVGPRVWDSLVKLYVDAGELERADSILHKAAQMNQQKKPLFTSYISLLDQYAKRGDIHNAEKIFLRMRQAGYVSRARPFSALLQAYINAKVPAYGFRERMKADNIYPNRSLAAQLAQVDAFKKTAVSELLD